jgi:hypothetical protein
MKTVLTMIVCGLFASAVYSRPVVIEDSAVLTRPDASWQYFGRFGVAVDGDYALVSGERYVADPAAEGGQRHEGAAFIYRRASATSWTYVGRLGPISPITILQPGLAMEGGVAIVVTDRYRIWQRTGDAWALQPAAGIRPDSLTGPDIEMDGGRIVAACNGCNGSAVVMHQVNNTWVPEGYLPGPAYEAAADRPALSLDLRGDLVMLTDPTPNSNFGDRILNYRWDSYWGWQRIIGVSGGPSEYLGPPVALAGINFTFASSRYFGTSVVNDDHNFAGARFRPADLSMQPDMHGATVLEHVGNLVAQRNYRYDTQGFAYHVFRVNQDTARTQDEVATLQPRDGAWLGNLLDATAGRVIVSGWDGAAGDNTVRVFELPASLDAPAAEVHDFEPPLAAATWQPTPGSAFSVVKIGYTSMYRQSSTAGTPGAFLPTSMGNQAIEADVTLRAVSGADRWIGLATRRSDDANYYYVTFRTSGSIELKRLQNGTITTLAAAPATLTVGQAYKLRLESIGTLQRVYLDNRLVLSARDRNLGEGVAGILMNRAAADWDNVTVTPNPFTTILVDDFSAPNDLWNYNPGTIQNGYLSIPTFTNRGGAIGGTRPTDQVVRVRIRPVSFAAPEHWVGIAGRYANRDHIYVTLYGRNVISLWKRTAGNITQLATQRFTVTPGTWYDLRLEIVANNTRVYVNGQQILQSKVDLGPVVPSLEGGGLALLTQQGSADFDDVISYQP